MEKKLMFLFSDNDGVSGICMDLSGVVARIEGELEGCAENDLELYEYTIRPVMMTQDEFDNLPEADI